MADSELIEAATSAIVKMRDGAKRIRSGPGPHLRLATELDDEARRLGVVLRSVERFAIDLTLNPDLCRGLMDRTMREAKR